MKTIAKWIDAINGAIGNAAAWLVLAMVLVQFIIVILRYVFGIGSLQAQEAVIYMHGMLFMVAAADTLRHDAHVRIDIFYARASVRRQHLINLIGALLFILPFCLLLWVVSFNYIALSWAVREGSRETSGLPAIYLLKSVILVFATQLALQGTSQAIKAWQGYSIEAKT